MARCKCSGRFHVSVTTDTESDSAAPRATWRSRTGSLRGCAADVQRHVDVLTGVRGAEEPLVIGVEQHAVLDRSRIEGHLDPLNSNVISVGELQKRSDRKADHLRRET